MTKAWHLPRWLLSIMIHLYGFAEDLKFDYLNAWTVHSILSKLISTR